MRSVKIALGVALALVVIAIGAVLAHKPLVVVGSNGVAPLYRNGSVAVDTTSCQAGGTLPAGTSALRISLGANTNPEIGVRVFAGSRLLTQGARGAGGGLNASATIPVRRVSSTVHDARVCITLGPSGEVMGIRGIASRPEVDGLFRLQDVRLGIEYLHPGSRSWWSYVSSIAYHFGLGRAAGGTWIGFFVIVLMLGVAALATRLALEDSHEQAQPDEGAGQSAAPEAHERVARVRAPRPERQAQERAQAGAHPQTDGLAVCAKAAAAAAQAAAGRPRVCPGRVPERGLLVAGDAAVPGHRRALPVRLHPVSRRARGAAELHEGNYSLEERAALAGLRQPAVLWHAEDTTISSAAEQRELQELLGRHLGRKGEGVGGSAADPPLYYLLELVPYALGSGGTILDQLELMRLLSALLAGLTGLFVFLFVRETLPRFSWAWTVGGLGVALSPLLGFTSGAVNPDSLLFAICAAIFYCLARAFRRGLGRGLAIAIGVLIAAGLLTKPNFIGLVPGIVLGLVALTVRAARQRRGPAIRMLALALAIPATPVCVYVLANLLASRPALGTASENLSAGKGHSILGDLSFAWQMYLPRLPGMTDYFPGVSSVELWFDRFVGLYGWLDTTFPVWVYTAALFPAGLLALLGLRALLADRAALRRRLAEPLTYAVMSVGLMGLIGSHAYLNLGGEGGGGHVQPRYLLPLLPLAGVALALAARGAGRRWGPAVGAVIIVLFLAYDVFSQLLVVSRFYA